MAKKTKKAEEKKAKEEQKKPKIFSNAQRTVRPAGQ